MKSKTVLGVEKIVGDPQTYIAEEHAAQDGKFGGSADSVVVTRDDEVNIAPETAYSLATGSPLPGWMKVDETVA